MAIEITFNGASFGHPGAYSKILVQNTGGFGLGSTGTVGIIGEALGGKPGVLDVLTKSQIQDAIARYKSGPIADALNLVANPSNDPRVPNGASKIVVYKVNPSTQSTSSLKNASATAVVGLASKNYGSDENNVNVAVSAGTVLDANAFILGTVAGPFNLAGGETLILVVNNTTYTYTGTLSGASVSAAALAADMNTAANWSSSTKPVLATASGNFIRIELDPVVVTGGELDYGYISVTSSSTLDTIVGIVGTARGVKGSRFVTLKKGADTEVSKEIGGSDVISIKYVGAGTACALTIQESLGQRLLTTACAGASADDLSIVLVDSNGKNRLTITDLVALIDSLPNYEANVIYSNASLNANELDYYSALPIKNVTAYLRRDIFDLVDKINKVSDIAVATKLSNVYRAVVTFSTPVFFTGAVDGASSNSGYALGFEAFKQQRINTVVPLISADSGAVAVDSVNALALAHAQWGWSTTGKSERNCFVSKAGGKQALIAAAAALNSAYVSICGQQPQVLNRDSDLVFLPEWGLACLCAGMQAGSETGEPITYKLLNCNDLRVEDGSWDPKKDGEEMIAANVTFAEPLDSGGFRVAVGNTTYGKDGNFVYNRVSVVEAAGFVAYDLRLNLESEFTGTKAKTGSAQAIANFIAARMEVYLKADITVGDDLNEGLGYKDLSVEVQGNKAAIQITVTPVQGLDFLLPTIFLADIKQSA